MYSQMVCLVGENPLPIYLGVKQLADKNAHIVLVHSEQTAAKAKHIRDTLINNKYGTADTIICKPIQSPYAPQEIHNVLKVLAQNDSTIPIGLNYTGGTKVMSAVSVLEWRERLGDAFYLEEESGKFWFFEGDPENLTEPLLLEELYDLHNIKPKGKSASTYNADDLRNIWEACRDNHDVIRKMKKFSSLPDIPGRYLNMQQKQHIVLEADRHNSCLLSVGTALGDFCNLLTETTQIEWRQASVPKYFDNYIYEYNAERHYMFWDKTWNFSRCASPMSFQVAFATGGWLEQVMAELLFSLNADGSDNSIEFGSRGRMRKSKYSHDSAYLFQHNKVARGQEFVIDDQMFESDLVVVYNYRLRYISVTTSRDSKTCKQKMFEAIHRASQIGGGLASACVVCLADKHTGTDRPVIPDLQRSIGVTSPHRFFGMQDLREWIDDGDAFSLRSFLTQNTPYPRPEADEVGE